MKINLRYVIAVVLVVVVAGSFFVFWQVKQGKIDLPVLLIGSRRNKFGEAAISFINANLLPPGTTASLMEVTNEGSVYKVKIKIGADEPDVYVSKDGKFLFTAAFELKPTASPQPSIQN